MELSVRLAMILLKYLTILLQPIYWLINWQRPKGLPAITNPLLLLSAKEIAHKIRNREISSEAVVEAYIERIKEVNPQLNAVIENRFNEAMREARACDKKLEAGEVNVSRLEEEQPLYGVPFTVKEACSLKGYSQTGCSLLRRNEKATEDSEAVELMKQSGAIPLCVTNTPELCTGFDSSNLLFGSTNNAYDARRIAGGSSGGEGALIATGASIIGIGSDIAGSIRVPSLFNGIFGHKPSTGVVPIKGHYPMSISPHFHKYLLMGPMARYSDDLLLAMRVLTKNCKENLRLEEPVDIKNLKIFCLEEFTKSAGYSPVDDDIKDAIKKAAKFLEGRGATVDDCPKVEEFEDIYEIVIAMFFCMENLPQVLINPDDPKNEKSAWIELGKALFGLSQHTKNAIVLSIFKDLYGFLPVSKLSYYREKATNLEITLENLLGTNGVLIVPSFPSSALFHNESFLRITGGSYCLLFNICGFPATQVPFGFNKEGLPVGFQVVANKYQDRLCLSVAKELEKGFGGWIAPQSR